MSEGMSAALVARVLDHLHQNLFLHLPQGSSGKISLTGTVAEDAGRCAASQLLSLDLTHDFFPPFALLVWTQVVQKYALPNYGAARLHTEKFQEVLGREYQRLRRRDAYPPAQLYRSNDDSLESLKLIIWDPANLFPSPACFYSLLADTNIPHSWSKVDIVTPPNGTSRVELHCPTRGDMQVLEQRLGEEFPELSIRHGRTYAQRCADRGHSHRSVHPPSRQAPVRSIPRDSEDLEISNPFAALSFAGNEGAEEPEEVVAPQPRTSSPEEHFLHVGSININGISSKALEVAEGLRNLMLDVVAFQETKLPSTAMVSLKGYRWFGRNYSSAEGVIAQRGLGFAIGHRLQHRVLDLPLPRHQDIFSLKFIRPRQPPLFLINVYLHPDLSSQAIKNVLEELGDLWHAYIQEGKVLVFGDFNCALTPSLSHDGSRIGVALSEWIRDHSATVLNVAREGEFEPTHVGQGGRAPRTLDYILASGGVRPTHHSRPTVQFNHTFGSDHLLLHGRVNVKLHQRGQPRTRTVLQLHRLHMRPQVRQDDDEEVIVHVPSDTALALSHSITEIGSQARNQAVGLLDRLRNQQLVTSDDLQRLVDEVDSYIATSVHAAARPLLQENIVLSSQDIGPDEEREIRARDERLEEYLASPSRATWEPYSKQRAQTAAALKKRKEQILKEYNDEYPRLYRDNPKEFWRRTKGYVRPARAAPPAPPAETFHSHFSDLFCSADPVPPLPLPTQLPHARATTAYEVLTSLQNATQDQDGNLTYRVHTATGARLPKVFFNLERLLVNLPNWKAAGKDETHYEYFKYTASASSELLKMLFILVWTLEVTPTSWSESLACPMFKRRGSPLDPNNYRSVYLENSIEKIYSLALQEHILPLINPQLAEEQFGFRPDRGTEDAIFIVNETLQQFCAKGDPLYMIFVDLTKAFDKVQWPLLFQKLQHTFGVPPQELRMIGQLYSNVQNLIRLNGVVHDVPFTMTQGVRQGNVLSPLLFAAYINDLIVTLRECRGATLSPIHRLFAPSKPVRSVFYADDFSLMATSDQEATRMLTLVQQWADTNGIPISDKTEWMGVNVASDVLLYYPLSNGQPSTQVVKRTSCFKYLGVRLMDNGSWEEEMRYRLTRVRKEINDKAYYYCNARIRAYLRLNIYKGLLRPILEFALPCLNLKNADILALERLQRYVVKRIMHVNIHTANEIVEGDTGLKAFSYLIEKARLRYCARLHRVDVPRDSLLYLTYSQSPETMPRLRNMPKKWAGSTAFALRSWLQGSKAALRQSPPPDEAVAQFASLFPMVAAEPREQLIKIRAALQQKEYARWRAEGAHKSTLTTYFQVKDKPIREKYLLWMDSPLASFWFKVRGDVLPTKEMLSRGDRGSPNCPFGCEEPETLEHLFFTCKDRTLRAERQFLWRKLGCRRHSHSSSAACGVRRLIRRAHPKGPSQHDEVIWDRKLLRQPPVRERVVQAAWKIWRARAIALTPPLFPSSPPSSPSSSPPSPPHASSSPPASPISPYACSCFEYSTDPADSFSSPPPSPLPSSSPPSSPPSSPCASSSSLPPAGPGEEASPSPLFPHRLTNTNPTILYNCDVCDVECEVPCDSDVLYLCAACLRSDPLLGPMGYLGQ
jgi:hypothetical protein